MENEDALQSGRMPTIDSKDFSLPEVDVPKSEASSEYGYLSQFPRSLNLFPFFGRYTNVIPEETDDAVSTQVYSTIQSTAGPKDNLITEVKKLGLTAQAPQVDSEIHKFEPYWVEVGPKNRHYDTRRQSVGRLSNLKHRNDKDHSDEKKTNVIQDDLALIERERKSSEPVVSSHDDLVDFRNVIMVPPKTGTESALESTMFAAVNRRGRMFRKYELTASKDIPQFSRGQLFGSKKGLGHRRSSSASNIPQLEGEIWTKDGHLDKYHSTENQLESFQEKVEQKSSGLRRTSSTGALQRLGAEHSFLDDQQVEYHKEGEKGSEIKRHESADSTASKGVSLDTSAVKNKLQSIGKKTVELATTSKVRQNKRERNMFAPTSF
ncbi:uncharacterized protein LOC127734949 [Mytilus californianus]|uniref:uncharacterized protein LOC127734949 n=1 Tax=Mytilus californianus TaxID=6549 RepID=UPI002246BE64|nr:uncharacterized protein LOC127734949 [Mytilus californianus]